jgi:hypothetical protein
VSNFGRFREAAARAQDRAMNSQGVAIVPNCDECGDPWLLGDDDRWKAEFIDNGPEDQLRFWRPECWAREFET